MFQRFAIETNLETDTMCKVRLPGNCDRSAVILAHVLYRTCTWYWPPAELHMRTAAKSAVVGCLHRHWSSTSLPSAWIVVCDVFDSVYVALPEWQPTVDKRNRRICRHQLGKGEIQT